MAVLGIAQTELGPGLGRIQGFLMPSLAGSLLIFSDFGPLPEDLVLRGL